MADPFIHSDYRALLKEELQTRAQHNPRYSLRAFARDLGLAPSRLSEILRGKQGLSIQAASDIGAVLGFDGDERERFCDLVMSVHARSPRDKREARQRLRQTNANEDVYQIRNDAFHVIADWYHFGILELMQRPDYQSDAAWLARKLGISALQVELACERLQRLGLITKRENRWVAARDRGAVPGGIPSASIRRFHGQIMEKAMAALSTQTIDERYVSSAVVSIDRKRYKQAQKAIESFRRRFCRTMEGHETKDRIYGFSVQFFRLEQV